MVDEQVPHTQGVAAEVLAKVDLGSCSSLPGTIAACEVGVGR